MTPLSIGRSKSCSVVVDSPTVSRHHADLTEVSQDRYRIEDRGSTSGSFRLESGAWQRFESAEFGRDDRVRMGDFECTLDELLSRFRDSNTSRRDSEQTVGEPSDSKVRQTVIERDPSTGQIVIRRQ